MVFLMGKWGFDSRNEVFDGKNGSFDQFQSLKKPIHYSKIPFKASKKHPKPHRIIKNSYKTPIKTHKTPIKPPIKTPLPSTLSALITWCTVAVFPPPGTPEMYRQPPGLGVAVDRVVVGDRVAVVAWQWRAWIGEVMGSILSGDKAYIG
jgi:hypothetical protein